MTTAQQQIIFINILGKCKYTFTLPKQHSGSIPRNACRLQNIALRDYQESVTTGQTDRQTDGQTDAGQSDPMCRFASQATQKLEKSIN